jgi:3-dehydroquinate dehydratase I
MRSPPDLFELRLDGFERVVDRLEKKLPRVRAPLIITARHPREGGLNELSLSRRGALLSRFLDHARYVDVELRSANALGPLLDLAHQKKLHRIISFHDFNSTPNPRILRVKARAANSYGADIFKVATRTDTPTQLARLLDFMTTEDVGIAVSAMGIGKLGAVSRILLAYCGSALNYVSLGPSQIEGQLSIDVLRSALRH